MAEVDFETFVDDSDAIVADIAKLLAGKTPPLVGYVLTELLAMYLTGFKSTEHRNEIIRLHVATALILANNCEPDHARH